MNQPTHMNEDMIPLAYDDLVGMELLLPEDSTEKRGENDQRSTKHLEYRSVNPGIIRVGTNSSGGGGKIS